MRTYKIAAMGGDGIGPEVVQAGVQVLKVCAERDGRFTLDFQDFDWGSDYYRTHGVMMPADGHLFCRRFQCLTFGVGSRLGAETHPGRLIVSKSSSKSRAVTG